MNSAVSLSTVTWVRLTPSWKCSEINEGRSDAAKVIFVESENILNTDHVFGLLLCAARSVSPSVVCFVVGIYWTIDTEKDRCHRRGGFEGCSGGWRRQGHMSSETFRASAFPDL